MSLPLNRHFFLPSTVTDLFLYATCLPNQISRPQRVVSVLLNTKGKADFKGGLFNLPGPQGLAYPDLCALGSRLG